MLQDFSTAPLRCNADKGDFECRLRAACAASSIAVVNGPMPPCGETQRTHGEHVPNEH
jgi:hypothetical protein